MINRRSFIAACACTGPLMSLSSAGRAQGLQRVVIGAVRSPAQAPTYIAIEKGFFAEEGIEVKPVWFDSSSNVFTGLVTGDIDVALTGTTASAFNLAGKGGFKIIGGGNQEKTGFTVNAFLVSNKAYDAGFTKFSEMKGKRIGVTTAGSTYHYYLGLLAKKYGIPLNQITMVPLGSLANVAAALKTSQIDAGMVPPAFARSMINDKSAHLLAWTGDEVKFDLGVIAAGNKALAEKRDLLIRFMRAQLRGTQYYAKHYYKVDAQGIVHEGDEYDALAEIIARGAGVKTQDLKGAFIYFSENLKFNREDITEQVKFWQDQGVVEKGADYSKIMDDSLT